jgi:1-acyl-sn-glycerol-3-phosphate acyltransferase
MPVADAGTPIEGGGKRPSPRSLQRTGHTAAGKLLYDTLWVLCRTLSLVVFGFRARFDEPMPRAGGLLVLASHQSHLDPVLLGLASPRRLSNLARSSLFTSRLLGSLITLLDAVPIDREASSLAAMKAIISRLKSGNGVVIFPEGTRTATGRLGEIKGGFALIARKAGVPIMPVAIVGAYTCWPRSRPLPRTGRIRLEFGRLITADQIRSMTDAELLAAYRQSLEELDARGRLAQNHARPPLTEWKAFRRLWHKSAAPGCGDQRPSRTSAL